MDRRDFLVISSSSMLVCNSPLLFATEGWGDTKSLITHSKITTNTGLSRRQWKTIVAVQDHLFPSEENAPGARDVNAKAFFYAVLSDAGRDGEDRKLIKEGLLILQDICWKKHKQTFIELKHDAKEDTLREFENTANGTAWIMTVLGYIFEALLTDPVYGGNPDGTGWKWLDHQPGFPRPTEDKRYFLL
ncbi:MAG: gluconate 2-dehydrogenase subunit 3 family protein [Gammaproteobacteria bacterium]